MEAENPEFMTHGINEYENEHDSYQAFIQSIIYVASCKLQPPLTSDLKN